MVLDALILRDKIVTLKKPVTLSVVYSEDGFWYVSSTDLRAYGSGRTVPEAIEDFCETCWWLVVELAGTPRSTLDESALTFLDDVSAFVSLDQAA